MHRQMGRPGNMQYELNEVEVARCRLMDHVLFETLPVKWIIETRANDRLGSWTAAMVSLARNDFRHILPRGRRSVNKNHTRAVSQLY